MNERVGVGAVGNPLLRVFQATVGGLPSTGAAASTPGTNSGTTRPNFNHLTGHDPAVADGKCAVYQQSPFERPQTATRRPPRPETPHYR
jgi:hypothetical protein